MDANHTLSSDKLARIHLLLEQGLAAQTLQGKHDALERLQIHIGPWICASCCTQFSIFPEECPHAATGCDALLEQGR